MDTAPAYVSKCEYCYQPTLFASWAYDAKRKRDLWVCSLCKLDLAEMHLEIEAEEQAEAEEQGRDEYAECCATYWP